jgi:hypothetical protein
MPQTDIQSLHLKIYKLQVAQTVKARGKQFRPQFVAHMCAQIMNKDNF